MYRGVSEQDLLLKVFTVPAKNFEANGLLFQHSASVAQVSVVEGTCSKVKQGQMCVIIWADEGQHRRASRAPA